jgi:hypothetical protein
MRYFSRIFEFVAVTAVAATVGMMSSYVVSRRRIIR